MSGLHTTLRILRDALTNTSPSSPILQVASANRLIVGAALASFRRSIKFFVDESCSSLTFFCLSAQEAPPEIPKTSSSLFQLLEPTATTTRLQTLFRSGNAASSDISVCGRLLRAKPCTLW
ncbi:hypothetical protein K435DRAFT_868940 [Dendrothele bispora CBS 962.96]|uniref:Uncharacterized protein n=1 Tax=Dendrothele bispora (strain CBS 962.96) TaxID=1314807 RepID=A0A4S8LAG8_DENBC|nr:hypothetical protein K435DRAFT_868940 [Dendrothele bispora CBS 962.96]